MSGPAFAAVTRYIVRIMLLANAKLPSRNTVVRAIFLDRARWSVHIISMGIHKRARSPKMLSAALPMKNASALIHLAPAVVGYQAALTGVHPKMDTKSVARNQHTTNVPIM